MKVTWKLDVLNENLKNYSENVYNNVHGWCCPEHIKVCDFLNFIDINKEGGLCEIGVEHGKSYLLYNSIISPEFKSYAIDIFDSQNLNVSNSGTLNEKLKLFLQNLNQYDVHKGLQTEIIPSDSLDYNKFYSEIKNIRIFHIDGGHDTIHILNDLEFANKVINNEGVVIVDDIMNYSFPSVTEGVYEYLKRQPTLVPFFIGFNKMYLCRASYHSKYMTEFKKYFGDMMLVNFGRFSAWSFNEYEHLKVNDV